MPSVCLKVRILRDQRPWRRYECRYSYCVCVLCDKADEAEEMLPPYQQYSDEAALLRSKPAADSAAAASGGTGWAREQSRESKTTSRTYTDPDGNVITEVLTQLVKGAGC